MVRKKVTEVKRISDDVRRKTTYSKRKIGLLKKAMELSQLCGVNVLLIIFDKENQRFVEYKSNHDFDANLCQVITCTEQRHLLTGKTYTNKDYDSLFKNNRTSIDNL